MNYFCKAFLVCAIAFLASWNPAIAQVVEDDQGRIEQGKYTILNNKFGNPEAFQNIWSWRDGQNWGWGSWLNQTDTTTVNTPSVILGWHWWEPDADTQLPTIIWDNDPLMTRADWSIDRFRFSKRSPALNVSYTLWFHDQEQQDDGLDHLDIPKAKISVWLHDEGGASPTGKMVREATIQGRKWEVWRGKFSTWDEFTFRVIGDSINQTELRLRDFIHDIVYVGPVNDGTDNRGEWMGNDRILSGVEFGAEVGYANAIQFDVSKMYIDVKPDDAPQEAATRQNSETLYVDGRHLYSPTGEKIILRGVNLELAYIHSGTWETFIKEVAKTNANCVRIVWDIQDYLPTDFLDEAIALCIENKMIPMVELHAATGGNSDDLRRLVDYWVRPDVVNVVNKHKRWMMLNVANEVLLNVSDQEFSKGYKEAIDRIRGTGVTVPIVIDASNFGNNYQQISRTWEGLRDRDPLQSVMFSIHTYWFADDQAALKAIYDDLVDTVTSENIPLLLGEGPEPTTAGDCSQRAPYGYGLQLTQRNEIGWLAWSWGASPNRDCSAQGGGRSEFDITEGGYYGNWNRDFTYGFDVIVGHPNSLQNTSVRPAGLR